VKSRVSTRTVEGLRQNTEVPEVELACLMTSGSIQGHISLVGDVTKNVRAKTSASTSILDPCVRLNTLVLASI
jgi:hypothetical protein